MGSRTNANSSGPVKPAPTHRAPLPAAQVLFLAAGLLGANGLSAVDTPPPAKHADAWTGSVVCSVDLEIAGYSRHETQTWTLTGDSAGVKWSGAIPLYPAKWKYSGQGNSRKVAGSDFNATVTTEAWHIDTEKDVYVAIFVRGSDQRITFHQWDATVVVPGAVAGTQVFSALGTYQPTPFAYAAEQWNFGWIDDDPAKTNVIGARPFSPPTLNAALTSSQPPDAKCTWNFTRLPGTAVTVGPPPAAATSGSYRIILNGFRVNQETFHDLLNPNGTGDDVYAGVHVHVATRNAPTAADPLTVASSTLVKTAVHGYVPPPTLNFTTSAFIVPPAGSDKVKAGTATGAGGLVNGDVFPTGQDPSTTTAAPVPNSFPLLLWQGQLTNGKDAVVIIPALWKSVNGDNASFDSNTWAKQNTIALWTPQNLGPYANQETLRTRVSAGDLTPIPFAGPEEFCVGNADLEATLTCLKFDHPIGLQFVSQDTALFPNAEVVVTREAAEAALNGLRSYGPGLPAGVIPLHFEEKGPNMRGNYDAWLRIERVPDVVLTTSTTPIPLSLPLAITSVTPNSGQQWSDQLVVTFEAPGAHFVQGRTALDLGPGVTVLKQDFHVSGNPWLPGSPTDVDVASPTKVLATLKIAGDAAPGPRKINLTTGSELATLANGFTIVARNVHDVLQINPASGRVAQHGLAVTIARPSPWPADYFQLATKLDFGPGIEVVSFAPVVGDDYLAHAKAMLNIAASAAVGPHTVTVTRPGLGNDSFPGAFSVTSLIDKSNLAAPKVGSVPALTAVSPATGKAGTNRLVITFTASGTHFLQDTTKIDLGPGITLADQYLFIVSPTQAIGAFKIDSAAAPGPRTVTITTGNEVVRLANGFTVTP